MSRLVNKIIDYYFGFPIRSVSHYKETSYVLDRIYTLAYFQACNRFPLGDKQVLIDKALKVYEEDKLTKPVIGSNKVDTVTCRNFDELVEDTFKLACVIRIPLATVLFEINHGMYNCIKNKVRESNNYPRKGNNVKKLVVHMLDKYLGFVIPKLTSASNKEEIQSRVSSLVLFKLRTRYPIATKDKLTLRIRRCYLDALDRPLKAHLGTCTSTRVTTGNFNKYFDDTIRIAHFSGIKQKTLIKIVEDIVIKESKKK